MNTCEYGSAEKRRLHPLAVCLVTLCVTLSLAQSDSGTIRNSDRTRSMEQPESRAQTEAEQLVSLSAGQIINLLEKEPGLLLQAKRLLVRKAYEQGRLLDPQDLTDEALFRLLREDFNVRVLITREIESRYYIRPKPTREELERGAILERTPQQKQGLPQPDVKQTASQEDAFWSDHDRAVEQYREPSQPTHTIFPPSENPAAPEPDVPRSPDPRRDIIIADSQPPDSTFFDGVPHDAMQMPRVRPDELPRVLNANLADKTIDRQKGFSAGAIPSAQLTSPPATFDTLPTVRELGSPAGRPHASPAQRSYPGAEEKLREQPNLRHRANPYSDVPALYDLYSQYSSRSPILERFGADVFRNGTGNSADLPMDLPVGPEYVLGPGDGLSIELWGGVSQRLQRVVDRQGRLVLPEVGAVEVSGRSLGDVQRLVQGVLRTQFRDVQADISLSRLRTVRVYVVGDVVRPGAYDISSLSTPLNALYTAGGPTPRGSLRILQHYRGKQLVQDVDVYDLLLHGIRSGTQGLQAGDTILIPPLGAEIAVEGMVRRPAMYEITHEKSLAEVLELAGGVLQSGTLRHVDVERVQPHFSRTMLRLDIPENNNQESVRRALEDFQVQDGDKIKISPILPYAEKTVYLDGHVFHPGKFAYREGMRVTDIVKSYNDLLPEPYKRHAEIIRLNTPDYTPTVLAFNLDDALAGRDQDPMLRPFDTVRIFSRFDFEDPPVITINGEVRDPGDHLTNGATYLRDAVYLAGGVTLDARLSDAQVFRRTEDGKLKVLSINLDKALSGDAKDNLLLEPKDRLFIHKNLTEVDPATVMIHGEVARPGKYPLGESMTAADLVRVAGGLKRGAFTDSADLTRYEVEHGSKVVGEHIPVQIARALAGEPDTDLRLHDGDVLSIRQLAGWKDIGATITVKGEVFHEGTYGIKEGERLSSIIARAGGFRADAYPYGAIFERAQVREMEERNRAELIRQVQDEGNALKSVSSNDQDDKLAKEASLQQWKTTLENLQSTAPVGRLVVHISSDTKRWANSAADIQVRAGDVIYIPKRPAVVMVDGSVYNPTAVAFRPGKSAGFYLSQAGGPTSMANKKAIFVIRADGSVVGGSGGLFTGGVEDAALQPGDMVVVPQKAFSGTTKWKNTLQVAQLMQSVAFAIQLGRTF
jgi:protein involved in polysaccharide export with SLBB domain